MRYQLVLSCVITAAMSTMGACSIFTPDYHVIEFKDEPCIRSDMHEFKTCDTLNVEVDHSLISIPSDFVTDLAQTARYVYNYTEPYDARFLGAAILLDYLYSCESKYGREQIDDIFYYALINRDIKKTDAYWLYLTVRLFGKMHYHPLVNCGMVTTLNK